MPWPRCDSCGRREATSIYGGRRTDGTPWELALCSVCDPEPEPPDRSEPPDWPVEPPPGVSDHELEELARRFGA